MNFGDENACTTHMKPPSRIPPPRTLTEMSGAASNARPPAMGPPQNKLKRKNDTESGGEPATAAPTSRLAQPVTNRSFIAGPSGQTSSFSKSSSNRHPGAAVRNTSFANSVGSERRAFSNHDRPQSATANPRMQRAASSTARPVSSLDSNPRFPNGSQGMGNKGRILFPSNPPKVYKATLKPESHGCYDPQIYCDSDGESMPYPMRRLYNLPPTTAFNSLAVNGKPTPSVELNSPFTPSQIPTRTSTRSQRAEISSPSKSPQKAPSRGPFLTRESNTRSAWDISEHYQRVDNISSKVTQDIGGAAVEGGLLMDVIVDYKARIKDLTTNNASLQVELNALKTDLRTSTIALEDSKRHHSIEMDDLQRQNRLELEENNRRSEEETRRLLREHEDEINGLKRRLENALEDEARHRRTEMQVFARENEIFKQRAELELMEQRKAVRGMEDELQSAREDLSREKVMNNELRSKLSEAETQSINLEVAMRSLRAQIEFLESDNKSQSNAFVDLETRLQNAIRAAAEANEKLRGEESLRRKLHNQVQELKGNIRVFCRVRPALESDYAEEVARITYPDTGAESKEVEILGPDERSSLGNITTKKNAFSFDRVFTPTSVNAEIFDEISQLVQSALDGYNVCIFCYGQTGSGKTYTMSSEDGMIPLAVRQIYATAKSLEEKGWKYSMEGSFIEVYNENLNDLLGKPDEFDKKKHEIRHDMQKCKTNITDITTVDLDTPNKVEAILRQATANRSVAATKANERSSRSHSVFILKLCGSNVTTGEKSEGTLNLVDLAGSERLSHSKATGDRLKETQNINKSLSCLGDVIGALGQGKEGGHVPYRNSKLTYLLQFSLGGNSKTLMFVMISPLQSHLSETLTSLKFATKVHNTHIGTAKRQSKVGNT